VSSKTVNEILKTINEDEKIVINCPLDKESLAATALLLISAQEKGIYAKASFGKEKFSVNSIEINKNILKTAFIVHKTLSVEPRYYLPIIASEDREFIEKALAANQLVVKKSLKIPGILVRPLTKALHDSFYIYIPGITANEQGIIKFLKEKGIPFKREEKLVTFDELSEEYKKEIFTEIIIRRYDIKVKQVDDIIMEHYLLPGEQGQFKDLGLVKLAIEALLEYGKHELAMGLLLNSRKAKEKAMIYLKNYLAIVSEALRDFFEKRVPIFFIEDSYIVLFNRDLIGKERIVNNLYNEIGNTIIAIFPTKEGSVIISEGPNYNRFVEHKKVIINEEPEKVFEQLRTKINI